jgi:Putative transposase/Transposase zinc-binding domain
VRAHRAALEAEEPVTRAERRVLSAITLCRTAVLGGHLDVCRACGHEHPAYNSCRNRHCPKCQLLAQEKWIQARAERVLPVRHFHVVFTLPSELRALARFRPKLVYAALFAAASATLLELGRSRLGAELGITMVLHTWTRDLRLHPHVHAIVSAGGLTDDGRWVASSTRYLFPVQAMGALLRGKFLHALSGLHARGDLDDFDAFREPDAFAHLMARLAKTRWVVYAKRPFRRVDHVLRYLGRYTHRVGIANSRLVEVTDDRVTFRTKNGKTVTLTPVEFLRRFLLHVLPDAFKKIRHYGLYAGAHVDTKLAVARALLAPTPPEPREDVRETDTGEWQDALERLTGRDVGRCPVCNGPIVRLALHPTPVRVPAWDTS